jgi:nitrite reductase (NADH) small subunit
MQVPMQVKMVAQTCYYDVGPLEDFPVQLGKTVHLPGRDIAVFRMTDGTVHALENRTAHIKGGPLAEGMVSGEFVYCPLRDQKISLLTGEVQAPDTGTIAIFPIILEQGRVWVGLPSVG